MDGGWKAVLKVLLDGPLAHLQKRIWKNQKGGGGRLLICMTNWSIWLFPNFTTIGIIGYTWWKILLEKLHIILIAIEWCVDTLQKHTCSVKTKNLRLMGFLVIWWIYLYFFWIFFCIWRYRSSMFRLHVLYGILLFFRLGLLRRLDLLACVFICHL